MSYVNFRLLTPRRYRNLYIDENTSRTIKNENSLDKKIRIHVKDEKKAKRCEDSNKKHNKSNVQVSKTHILNDRERSLLNMIETIRKQKIRPGFRYYLDTVRLFKTKKKPILDSSIGDQLASLDLDHNHGVRLTIPAPAPDKKLNKFLCQQLEYIKNNNNANYFPLRVIDLQNVTGKKQTGLFVPSKREIKRFQDLQTANNNRVLTEAALCFYVIEYDTKTLIPVFLPHFMERAGEMLQNKYNDLFARRPVCQEHFFYLAYETALLHRLAQASTCSSHFQKTFSTDRKQDQSSAQCDTTPLKNKPVIFLLEHHIEQPTSIYDKIEDFEWLSFVISDPNVHDNTTAFDNIITANAKNNNNNNNNRHNNSSTGENMNDKNTAHDSEDDNGVRTNATNKNNSKNANNNNNKNTTKHYLTKKNIKKQYLISFTSCMQFIESTDQYDWIELTTTVCEQPTQMSSGGSGTDASSSSSLAQSHEMSMSFLFKDCRLDHWL